MRKKDQTEQSKAIQNGKNKHKKKSKTKWIEQKGEREEKTKEKNQRKNKKVSVWQKDIGREKKSIWSLDRQREKKDGTCREWPSLPELVSYSRADILGWRAKKNYIIKCVHKSLSLEEARFADDGKWWGKNQQWKESERAREWVSAEYLSQGQPLRILWKCETLFSLSSSL